MAGDEDKKKKKKGKKEEAPPPAPEPEPEPAPKGGMMDDEEDDWLNAATEETNEAPPAQEAAPAEEDDWLAGCEETPAEGEGFAEGEEGAEMPPQPKKKPKFFVHWNRRKPRFYDYNFDYGTNYYSSMVGYVDSKNAGHTSVPRRMAFAERGMVSSLQRSRNPDTRTETLLHDIRSNIRNFESSQKVYAYGKK